MYTVQGNSGYWAPFKTSQNLPKHSAATRAATWSLTTPAVCGDPQTSWMGTVLTWVVPVHLQFLSPLTIGALVGGYREVDAPLSSLLDGPGQVDWHCSVHFLWGKQQTVPSWTDGALSDSNTVVHSISLIILLLTGYNHSLCFYFPSLCFHLALFIIWESANMYVSVIAFQSKYYTSSL